MPKRTPAKCLNCAKLHTSDARVKYASCWNPNVCYSKRSYINNKDKTNKRRNLKRQKQLCEEINIDFNFNVYSANLIVYRKPGNNTLVYAIEVEIFNEKEKIAIIKPVITAGLKKYEIEKYIENILNTLNKKYNIEKFSLLKTFDISLCPLQ